MGDYLAPGECEDRQLYRIQSRNLITGVYREESGGFIGIRTKFDDHYLFQEFHWDTGGHHGTVRPIEALGVKIPDGMHLGEYLPGSDPSRHHGSWCDEHDRECEFIKDDPTQKYGGVGKWFHLDDGSQMIDNDHSRIKINQALYDFLLANETPERRNELENWDEIKAARRAEFRWSDLNKTPTEG